MPIEEASPRGTLTVLCPQEFLHLLQLSLINSATFNLGVIQNLSSTMQVSISKFLIVTLISVRIF
jgi:hypothetical protein